MMKTISYYFALEMQKFLYVFNMEFGKIGEIYSYPTLTAINLAVIVAPTVYPYV